MRWDPTPLETVMGSAMPKLFPAAQVVIRQGGELLSARTFGYLDPGANTQPVQLETRFDLASITKLYTATACVSLIQTGHLHLEQPLSTLLPEWQGSRPICPYEDPLQPGQWIAVAAPDDGPISAEQVTLRQLLTHTSGLPAWRPLFRQPDAASARQMAINTFFSYRPGSRVIYSDIGFILLGFGLERLTEKGLDQILQNTVLDPLNLRHTQFFPLWVPFPNQPTCAPTEFCTWRQRRIIGQVHDENAARLGGIAAHAGLFASAENVAIFGESFLQGSLLKPETVAEMTREQVGGRGLGFALRSADPLASSSPFSASAFGHTGFTGTSLWVDPQRDLVVVLLTNAVYHGRHENGFQAFRVAAHQAILEGLS